MLAIDTNTPTILNTTNPSEKISIEVNKVSVSAMEAGEVPFVELRLTHTQAGDLLPKVVIRRLVLAR